MLGLHFFLFKSQRWNCKTSKYWVKLQTKFSATSNLHQENKKNRSDPHNRVLILNWNYKPSSASREQGREKKEKIRKHKGLKVLPTRIPKTLFLFQLRTHAHAHTRTITPPFLSNTNTPSAAPAGSWRFAWCRRQGILGAVRRKWRGVNWVSAGCKGLALILLMLCHPLHPPTPDQEPPPAPAASTPHPHPMGYRWPKWGHRVVFRHSWRRLLFPPALYLPPVFFSERSRACEREERKVWEGAGEGRERGRERQKKVQEGDGVDREQTGFSPRNVKSNWRWWNLKV